MFSNVPYLQLWPPTAHWLRFETRQLAEPPPPDGGGFAVGGDDGVLGAAATDAVAFEVADVEPVRFDARTVTRMRTPASVAVGT